MTRTYHLNDNGNSIFCRVNVSTPGIAFTQVTKRRQGGSFEDIASSTGASGKIPRTLIGKANLVRDCVLEITTIIDLQTVPKPQWPVVFENLVIQYTMEGGADGMQMHPCDNDDKKKSGTGKIIVVTKAIRLTII
jgi:hypothetical protein